MSSVLVLAALALTGPAVAPARACYDLGKSEPHSLVGVVERRLFPASMAQAMQQQATEPGFLLLLDAPICLTGADALGYDGAGPGAPFLEVEIRASDAQAAVLTRLEGSRAHVELSHPYPAMTVHEHRPLVAYVESAVALAPPVGNLGAAVVGAFYEALGAGRGAAAAALIAPPHRRGGLSAEALSRFYGGFSLKLAFVLPQDHDRYLVRYRFARRGQLCEGRALVTTSTQNRQTFIESLRALDGC